MVTTISCVFISTATLPEMNTPPTDTAGAVASFIFKETERQACLSKIYSK